MSQSVTHHPAFRAMIIFVVVGLGLIVTARWVVDGAWFMAVTAWAAVVGILLLPYPRAMAAIALASVATPLFLLRPQLGLSNVATVTLLIALVLAYPKNRHIWTFSLAQALIGLYLINLVVIMFSRGFGLLVFGGEGAGAMSYVRLLLAGGLVFGVIWYPLSSQTWKWVVIGLAIFSLTPLIADICYAYGIGMTFLPRFLASSGLRPGEAYLSGIVDSYFLRFTGAKETAIWCTVALIALARPDRLFGLGTWRYAPFLAFVAICAAVSGFRIALAIVVGMFVVAAVVGRQVTVPRLLALSLVGCTFLVLLYGFASELPLSMQRTVSFLPGLEVSPVARTQALDSLDWRWEVWKAALPEVPKHLLLGKGFTFNVASFIFGQVSQYDWALLNSTYHNGPLSTLILTGLPGTLSMLGLQILLIVRHGREQQRAWVNPTLKNYHLAFYAYFIIEVGIFWIIYGDVSTSVVLLFRQAAMLEGVLATEWVSRRARAGEAPLEGPPPVPALAPPLPVHPRPAWSGS